MIHEAHLEDEAITWLVLEPVQSLGPPFHHFLNFYFRQRDGSIEWGVVRDSLFVFLYASEQFVAIFWLILICAELVFN